MINKFNEINNKYGKLTVVARAPNYKNGSAQWYCICDCGNLDKIKVRASSLRDGHTKSCGCLVSEITKQIHSGKFVSNETRQKMSDSRKGFKPKPESILKMKETIKNRVITDEWRKNMSKSANNKGSNNGKKKLKEDVVIEIKKRLLTNSAMEVANEFNLTYTIVWKIKKGHTWKNV